MGQGHAACCSNFAASACFGTAPITWSTSFPSSPEPWFTEQSLLAGGWTVVHRNGTTVVLERPGTD